MVLSFAQWSGYPLSGEIRYSVVVMYREWLQEKLAGKIDTAAAKHRL
ncbi:unknow [Vibrio campbellii]|nr:unknow [Vibrio campbellii]